MSSDIISSEIARNWPLTFSHIWVDYDAKKMTLRFSQEAEWILTEMIRTIQSWFALDHIQQLPKRTTEQVIENMGHAVGDVMVDTWKSGKSIRKWFEQVRATKAGTKKWKKGEVVAVEQEHRKQSWTEYSLIEVEYEWNKLPVPLIVRPDDSLSTILASFHARVKYSSFIKP